MIFLMKRYRFRTIVYLTIIVALAATACNKSSTPLPLSSVPQSETVAMEQRGIRLNLAEYLEVAEIHTPLTQIRFNKVSDFRYLVGGWHNLEIEGEQSGRCWTTERSAAIDIPCVSKEELTIRMLLSPPAPELLPQQSVQVFWNQQFLGTYPLPARLTNVEIVIPSERIHYGVNRLELRPRFWFQPALLMNNEDLRNLGVLAHRVEILQSGYQAAEAPMAATREGGAILQYPSSVISSHFALPQSAVIRGKGMLHGDLSDLPEGIQGHAIVSVLDEKGKETLVFERTLANLLSHREFSFQERLMDLSGQMVSVNLTFHAAESDLSVSGLCLEWTSVQIEGIEQVPVRDEGIIQPGNYNILIVLFDALRADQIEPYGNQIVRTPNMSRLASRGVTFLNAFSQCCWTRTSVASLLTSLYPSVHQTTNEKRALSSEVQYLPEILHGLGYRTAIHQNNPNIASIWGFDRGFDVDKPIYEIKGYDMVKDNRNELAWEAILSPLLQADVPQPFFVYYHDADPHSPYTPPAPYDRKYDPDYLGGIDGSVDVLKIVDVDHRVMFLKQSDIHHIQALYQGEISYMDELLGRILDRLEETGLDKNTLVVFLSDHGEEFMEHGGFEHSKSLYEEVLHVPLILSLPGVIPQGKKIAAHAQLVDVPPTILDLLGMEIPASMQGTSLLSLISAGEDYVPDRPTFAEWNAAGYDLLSVRFRQWKLIGSMRYDGVRQWSLYNLKKDPMESVNYWVHEARVGKTLLQMLQWQMKINAKAEIKAPLTISEDQMDPEMVQRLRGLGYIR